MPNPYSPKGTWPTNLDESRHEPHEKKSGPNRESTAESGHSSGPISGHDVTLLREGIGGLLEQGVESPIGEDGYVKRTWDEHGRKYLEIRFWNPASQTWDWYRVRMTRSDDRNFEVPEAGAIDVGGLPTVRPIIVLGGSFRVPSGGAATVGDEQIALSAISVARLPAGAVTNICFQVPIPDGYNLGPLQSRYYAYPSAPGVGTVILGSQAFSVGDGEGAPTVLGTYEKVTITTVAATQLIVSGLTAEYTPQGSSARGEEMHFFVQRDGVTDTYASPIWISKMQTFYRKDRHSDVAA